MTTIGRDSKRSNSLSYFYWTNPAFHLFFPLVVSCMSAYWLWNRDQRLMHWRIWNAEYRSKQDDDWEENKQSIIKVKGIVPPRVIY